MSLFGCVYYSGYIKPSHRRLTNIPFPMMESHVLWYIVLDDSASHTSVDIHSAHSINDLKKAINSQRKDIPVSNMILWKVTFHILLERHAQTILTRLTWQVTNCIMISLPHRKRADLIDEINRIQIPDSDSDEARTGSGELQFLDSVLPVSYYWKERPEPLLLHLIVQVPRKSQILTQFETTTHTRVRISRMQYVWLSLSTALY